VKNITLVAIFCFVSFTAFTQKAEIVICADLSGSTNGMIVSLQKTIWSVVNEMDANESIEEVKFALVGYGRKSFGKENNFTKILQDLSIDVNKIGYTLLKSQLTIQGCDAYPEKGINDCINNISWSKTEDVQRIIIIIGNGGISYKQMEKQVKKAQKKAIKITPVYYKSRVNAGEEKQWKDFAEMCDNELRVATPSNKNIVFKKTYDTKFIQETGGQLKHTYIPYGEEGKQSQKKFNFLFDHLKESSPEGYEEMLVYQSSYHVQGQNKNWDLVDLAISGDIDYEKIKRERLPLFLQSFTDEQLSKYVNIKIRERKLLIKKIRLELNKRRNFTKLKQVKSQHFVGKGGLSVLIQLYLKAEFSN
jgi:hypothetical protein